MVVCFDLAMFNRILLLLLLILPNTAPAGIILVVGDSLSAAYGIPVEQGWVALLAERLDTREYPFRIVNASISGDTTANARARLPDALATHAPSVVLLALGGNDGLRALSLEAMKDNLAAMIASARKAGAQILLIGVQLPPNYGPRYTERFQAVYRELAREHDYGPAAFARGRHRHKAKPDAAGWHSSQCRRPAPIRDRVWEALEPLLERTDNIRALANPGLNAVSTDTGKPAH